jgi:hypothetical protein
MKEFEIFTLVLSGVAILISAAALWASVSAARGANKANREVIATQHAQTEFQIREGIQARSEQLQKLALDAAKIPKSDTESMQLLAATLRSAQENFLNAYDVACASYRDGKIDKIRFKKSYQLEIHQLVTDPSFHDLLFPEATSGFKAILAVHDEWENAVILTSG